MQVHAKSREVRHSKLAHALLTASVALMALLPGATLYAQTEVTPGAGAVTASANDGNVPGNTVDNNLATRWSANGDGQWIRYDLGSSRLVAYVRLAFYNGNLRTARFDLQTSSDGAAWTNVLTNVTSSGTTTQEQTFDFADRTARYVRYVGHGNSANLWNSLTEVSIFAADNATATPTPTPTRTPTPTPTPSPTPTPTPLPGWTLTWSDEFNAPANTSVDPLKWNIAQGDNVNNHERQMYTNRLIDLRHDGLGHLILQANKGGAGYTCWYGPCEYTSSRINTSGKFSLTYGRVEARLALTIGQGMWPAFWMLGVNENGCGGWPKCGEIDIMENLGHQPQKLYGTVHGPGYSGGSAVGGNTLIDGPSTEFHVYAIEWEPNVIRWYVDGRQYFSVDPSKLGGDPWVFNHRFYMILNVAVGGDWPGPPNSSTVFPNRMLADYVRVYSR